MVAVFTATYSTPPPGMLLFLQSGSPPFGPDFQTSLLTVTQRMQNKWHKNTDFNYFLGNSLENG